MTQSGAGDLRGLVLALVTYVLIFALKKSSERIAPRLS